jgi:hypothetical protein
MASIEARGHQALSQNTMDPLTPVYRIGLIPVGVFAIMSLLSVIVLLAFITHRLILWRRFYKEYVGYNQYIILIYNLLLADLQQAISFAMSFHWLRINSIQGSTMPCFVQAWFLNLGDVSSGFFVLAIAIHTWLGVVRGYKMTYPWFITSILFIWLFALVLTVLGPAMYHERFFARAGGWVGSLFAIHTTPANMRQCWVSIEFQPERLWLHYLWIFIVEFGTMAIYGHVFLHLRGRIQGIANNDTAKLTRATKFMVLYPAVYVVLTLPIAVGRMVVMTGTEEMPDIFFIVSGCLLTSCGWIDALLYALTRRILVSNHLSDAPTPYTGTATHTTNPARPADVEDFNLLALKKESATSRTVTIVGGRSSRLSRVMTLSRGRSTRSTTLGSASAREHSPTGSQDSIIRQTHIPEPLAGGGVQVHTDIEVEVESASSGSGTLAR